jgi:hypothetical protein
MVLDAPHRDAHTEKHLSAGKQQHFGRWKRFSGVWNQHEDIKNWALLRPVTGFTGRKAGVGCRRWTYHKQKAYPWARKYTSHPRKADLWRRWPRLFLQIGFTRTKEYTLWPVKVCLCC